MIYCISDIHGEYDLFLKLMDKVGFGKDDTLVVLGDIIDKGKDSVRLLKLLLPHPNCKIILGNHEYDFLKFYHSLMRQAKDNCDYSPVLKALQQYFPQNGELLSWEIVDMLECLPAYIEFDNFIGVHAGVPIDNFGKVNLSKATTEQLVYDRNFNNPNFLPRESKCVIYGHTPTRYISGEDRFIFYPRNNKMADDIGNFCKICIDTGVYLSGTLGCLRIDDCKEFYVKKEL